MKVPGIVLVGLGGYGLVYRQVLEHLHETGACRVLAGVDPAWPQEKGNLKDGGIDAPVFRSLDECFAEIENVDLTIIASPVPFHLEQASLALRAGSHVLCEKPLVPLWADADRLQALVDETGLELAVGIQWCFSQVWRTVKQRLAAGDFGAPKRMEVLVSWPRHDRYYEGSWHGQVEMPGVGLALDSIVANATAHYLHTMFWLLGETEAAAAWPTEVEAEIYRSKPIGGFDTCFLRGRVGEGGPRFVYAGSHSSEPNEPVSMRIVCERATLLLGCGDWSETVRVEWRDRRLESLGDIAHMHMALAKVRRMLAVVRGEAVNPCTIASVRPHLGLMNALWAQAPIVEIGEPWRVRSEDGDGWMVDGMRGVLGRVFETGELPSEAGVPWAVAGATGATGAAGATGATSIDLSRRDLTAFLTAHGLGGYV
ncbi:MAG: Gfo/Idh/MocA family oxidoreductase [Bacillota bacterium]|nr:Gfo/Idh/MocA family oxidoreductase [Bacillota bacterium]